MVSSYAFLGVFTLAAIVFPLLPLVLAWLIRPRRPTPSKQATYECGIEVVGDSRVQFKVQYYLYAISFLIFDVELVFVYPVAVALGRLDLFALLAFSVFLAMLGLGLLYEWKKGILDWI